MLPEISRRCLACGASVRAGARFCPQCGHGLAEDSAGGGDAGGARAGGEVPAVREPPPTRPGAETAPREEARALRETREVETPAGGAGPTTREAFAPPPEVTPPGGASVPATRETAAHNFGGGRQEPPDAAAAARTYVEAPPEAGAAGRSRRAAARVRETVVPRVEKIRDEALVVLEETPDDSGLRFVVIAVLLFGLFLFFLLLSTTVLR